jgi:MFS family permease
LTSSQAGGVLGRDGFEREELEGDLLNEPIKVTPARMILLGVGWFGVNVFWAFHSGTMPLFLANFTDSKFTISLVLSLAGLSGLVMPPLAGYLSDRTVGRFGRRRPWVLIGMLGVLACVLGLPHVGAFGAVALLSGLMYFGLRTAETPFLSLLPDITPQEQRATASGVMNLLGSVGLISCFVVSALVWERSPAALFAIVGVASFGFVLVSTSLMREPEAPQRAETPPLSPLAYLKSVTEERNAMKFLIAQFFWWLGFWMISTFLILFVAEELEVAEGQAFLVPMAFSVVATVVMLPMGMLGDRFGRKGILSWMIMLWAVAGLAIALSQNLTHALLTVGFTAIPFAAVMAVGYAFLLDLIPGERTAEFVGISVLSIAAAQVVGPLIGGELIDLLGYRWLFPVASVAQLVGVALLQYVEPQR